MEEYRSLFRELHWIVEDISKFVAPEFTKIDELPLNQRQVGILHLIIRRNKITASEIAEHYGITKSAVSQSIAALEKHQFIVRSINEDNRREVKLELGPRGLETKQRLEEIETTLLNRYISKLDLKDIQHVKNVLVQLRDIMHEFREEHRNHEA
ncbi:MarR family winged helix-turn-helix transcriptional regulator [Halalkalibacterium ligniniphilum]|uniref:MarR family winged helix-turn-helix transcriptional regulator n=1 Tax=Halalkalibacterium ligniniphilum TaxID=1134413 RepID=UPI0003479217|nr:MarR family transcriptional regulator [Halalkalibacterium ligniniphilum]